MSNFFDTLGSYKSALPITITAQKGLYDGMADLKVTIQTLNTSLTSILSAIQANSGITALQASAPVLTNVLLSSVQIAPANPNRKGFIVFNNSTNSTYVTMGATSSSASCTKLIATFTSWECYSPYTGVLSAIRNAGSGNAVFYDLIPA